MMKILRHRFILLACAAAISTTAFAQNSPNITDPLTMLTYKDSAGACTPQRADAGAANVTGCCAAPGRRSCAGNGTNGYSLPACLSVDPSLKPDAYGIGTLCTLAAPAIDPVISTLGQTGTEMTFYVTSDIHFFRRTYNLTDQITHVQVLNNFFSTGADWPVNSGIPANTAVAQPLAVIIDGDFTTHGLPEDLGAFRVNYERGTIPASLQYPVLFGLGNHETVSDETPDNAQRMFDYLQTRMANTHIDPQSGNYSWDWQGIHFVQLNTWAGDKTSVYVHASDGLTWLDNDLRTYVGNSTKPVMLFEHYMLADVIPSRVATTANDDFFPADSNAIDSLGNKTGQGYESFFNIVKNYNIIAMFGGHDHCLGVTSSLLTSLPVKGKVYPAVSGYGVAIDDFDDGSGGDTHGTGGQVAGVGNACAATTIDGQSITQTAVASFLVTHVNQQYLDVAAVSWTGDGSTPYFDQAEGLPTAALACHKRINTQFIAAPPGITITQTTSGYSVLSSSATPANIPVALKFGSKSGVSGFNFVDNCADPGDRGANNLYFLVNGEDSLAANTAYAVAGTRTVSVTPTAVLLTPLSGATPATFQHITAAAPANDAFVVYGPPNTAFTTQITYSGTATGWLALSATTGTFNAYGVAALTIQYTTPVGGFGTSAATIQITASATSVVQSVAVSITEPTVALALSSATAYQGEAVTLTATLSPVLAGTTIRFTNGSTLVGTAQTNAAGIATYIYTASATGTFSFVAGISGSNAAGSPAQTLTVGLPVTLAVSPNPITILPGSSGAVTASLTPYAGFTGSATLVCSVPVSYITCTVASPTLAISSSAPASAVATIQVAATTSSLATRSHGGVFFAMLMPITLLGLARHTKKRRRRLHSVLLLVLGAAVFAGIAGCGSGGTPPSSSPHPSGSQLITFTATAAGSAQSATITVNFQ
jgi:Calcineurin-like phosphoesterase